MAVGRKKAKQLAEEIMRCEMVLQNLMSTDEEKQQAMTKIRLIAEAYGDNPEVLYAIAMETEKLISKLFDK